MKKLVKKTVAAVIATAMISILGISANATEPVMKDDWSVTAVAVSGAPSGTGSSDSCYMVYSPVGIKVFCNEVKNTVNGGTGKVTITCTTPNVTMPSEVLRNTGESVTCHPQATGAVLGVWLKFTPWTSTYGNTYTASGNAETISN